MKVAVQGGRLGKETRVFVRARGSFCQAFAHCSLDFVTLDESGLDLY
jgi:hypothetical protein